VSYALTIIQQRGFLHVMVTGQNSVETVGDYIRAVVRECATRQCHRVLIEERLVGPRLGMVDVFTLLSEIVEKFRGALKSIALVDINAQGGTMRFAEDVAVNRGAPFRVFPSVAAAEQWLLGEIQRSAAAQHNPPP
jgi:hypothetical protein